MHATKTDNHHPNICVLGGGNFGTTLANLISLNGYPVQFWLRDPEQARHINQKHRNYKYMAEVKLDPAIQATTNMEQAIRTSRLLLFALPGKAFAAVFTEAVRYITPEHFVVSTSKGIYQQKFKLTSVLIQEMLAAHHQKNTPTGIISGPNLAKEIIFRQPTATVIASKSKALQHYVTQVLTNDYFRVYMNHDIQGVELGGVLKNCYAVASGIIDALGMGDNTKSMLLTRALAEMNRFAVCFGANPLTFLGLTGIGDLIVTCLSPLSRNYQVGYQLGSGKTLDYALDHLNGVSEGIHTIRLVYQQAQELNIHMPLLDAIHKIIYADHPAKITLMEGLTHHQNDLDVEFDLDQVNRAP